MDWKLELMMAGRAIAAAFLGALIGWDRERHGQDAGVRSMRQWRLEHVSSALCPLMFKEHMTAPGSQHK